uniref:Uncharacterized protein n=1 Tax=Cajanus cajan TaxID=3821 RepID=A0A151RI85_CAJCA|nr:hypothetical protein KK1_036471 [Cajanus cajan]
MIKKLEELIRNFIWSGNPFIQKYVPMSWKKVCQPLGEGGLELRLIHFINHATYLK